RLRQVDGPRLVIVVLERLFQRREARAGGFIQAVLARAAQEADIALAALESADQRARDFLFRKTLGVFFAISGIHHDGAFLPDSRGARQLRLLHGIDVIDLQL